MRSKEKSHDRCILRHMKINGCGHDNGRIIRLNREIHDSLSTAYEDLHEEIFNPTEQQRIRQILLKAAGLVETGTEKPLVLDFGAGTGNITLNLLSLGLNVVATDISKGILDQLYRNIVVQRHRENLAIVMSSGADLSNFKDGSFDMTVSYSVLHHVPDYLSMVNELVRVLKPGGILLIDHEVCPSYWQKDADYLKYLNDLGEKYYFNHLNEIKAITWKLLWNKLFRYARKMFSLKSWINLFHKIKPDNDRTRMSAEGDIHVFLDDHINWDLLRSVVMKNGDILIEQDYLVCRELNDYPVYWNKWKHICHDMRVLIARKNNNHINT